MKLSITGASHFVTRMFEACGIYQWAREFLRNAVEAGATKVLFGVEWQAVEKFGKYRRTVIDDGMGMTADELRRFFSTLGEGGKKIGGVHDNFGVGAKIASLPWNPEGVVVVSYKDGVGSMLWIVFDEESGDYQLVEFDTDEGKKCVVAPDEFDGVDWSMLRPDWVRDHGTIIVLLGSEENPDTVLGNVQAGEQGTKGLTKYLNTRFWDLSDVVIRVAELRGSEKKNWPQSANDKDDARRTNARRTWGARRFITDIEAKANVGEDDRDTDEVDLSEGRTKASGTLLLGEGRVAAECYLWEGNRPNWVHQQAKKGGYIAIRYKGELFQLTSNKLHFRWFGVIENKVQQNLTIILEPKHYNPANGRWGVHPDQSRNRLIFSGNGDKGAEIPLSDWAQEFAQEMPEEILAAICAARADHSGTIEDEEYRKRLQDKFGLRWSVKQLVATSSKDSSAPATPSDESIEVEPESSVRENATPKKKSSSTSHGSKTRKVARKKKAVAGGDAHAIEMNAPVDVPRYRFGTKGDFQAEWHLAVWAPADPKGPHVVINAESPILEEIVRYHQDQYHPNDAEEVGKAVRHVFGEIAACKVAHSQKLAKMISAEELDAEYRSEKALTVALMGLLAEEAVLAQRLAKFARKKAA